jgi:hypothetical protein
MEEILQNEFPRLQRRLVLRYHESEHPPNHNLVNRDTEKHAIREPRRTHLAFGDITFLNVMKVIFSLVSLKEFLNLFIFGLSLYYGNFSQRFFANE